MRSCEPYLLATKCNLFDFIAWCDRYVYPCENVLIQLRHTPTREFRDRSPWGVCVDSIYDASSGEESEAGYASKVNGCKPRGVWYGA